MISIQLVLSQFQNGLQFRNGNSIKSFIKKHMLMQIFHTPLQKIRSPKYTYLLSAFIWIYLFFSIPVLAHHPWDGELQELDFMGGVFSGLAHPTPILGFDHFLFLLSIGLVGATNRSKLIPSLVCVGLIGAILSQFLPLFPAAEFVMGLTLVASALVALKKVSAIFVSPLIFAHGFVLVNAMIGFEQHSLFGYLTGLLISQSLILFIGSFMFEKLWKQKEIFCAIFLGAGLVIAGGSIL